MARSAVEVIRVEHPGSQLDGSVVACLRVIELKVDVDLDRTGTMLGGGPPVPDPLGGR